MTSIMDNFPRIKKLTQGNIRAALTVGAGAGAGVDADVNMHAPGDTLACELSTITGPFACMHNEHNKILENQRVINAKLDRILAFLDSKFEGSP